MEDHLVFLHRPLAVETGAAVALLGLVGPEDQFQKCRLPGRQLLLSLFFAQIGIDPDRPLAGGMNGELAQVAGNPLAPQLLGHGGGGAGTAEEVGDEVAFVG